MMGLWPWTILLNLVLSGSFAKGYENNY